MYDPDDLRIMACLIAPGVIQQQGAHIFPASVAKISLEVAVAIDLECKRREGRIPPEREPAPRTQNPAPEELPA